MSVLYGVNQLIEFFVFSFFHLTKFAESCLFELNFVCIIFFNSLSFNLVFVFKFIKFLDMLFLHSINFFNFFVILEFLSSFTFRYFVVEFIDKAIVKFFSFLI